MRTLDWTECFDCFEGALFEQSIYRQSDEKTNDLSLEKYNKN
jgi:hypothetical protein